ncbi:MAG: phage late control D family protein [Gammaproteobacteria bacterium]
MQKTSELPDINVRINGKKLPVKAFSDLATITVQEDLDAPGMFSLELYNWDMDKLKITWSDAELFEPGNEVEIWLGYVDALHKVMLAEITSLEPVFEADESPMLTVRGYDLRHRLLRGRRTRSFTKMKDSAIARQIAGDAGLQAKVTDSKVSQDYVLQHNQTDLDFLQERAGRIGYEVFVRSKTLYFQPPQNKATEGNTVTLSTADILEFSARLSTDSQVGELVVRGWDVNKKEAIVGKAKAGEESTRMGGSKSGASLTDKAFGKSSMAGASEAVLSKAEADQMALGQFNELALAYISGEGTCRGEPKLRAGTVVKIEGAGKKFSGPYYVTSTTHSVSEDGFTTAFTVRRNAA